MPVVNIYGMRTPLKYSVESKLQNGLGGRMCTVVSRGLAMAGDEGGGCWFSGGGVFAYRINYH